LEAEECGISRVHKTVRNSRLGKTIIFAVQWKTVNLSQPASWVWRLCFLHVVFRGLKEYDIGRGRHCFAELTQLCFRPG